MPDLDATGVGYAGLGNIWADAQTTEGEHSGANFDRTFEGYREKLVRAYQGYVFLPAQPDDRAQLKKYPVKSPYVQGVVDALELKMAFLGVDGQCLEDIRQEAVDRQNAAEHAGVSEETLGAALGLDEPS